jgi:hypothetical protein
MGGNAANAGFRDPTRAGLRDAQSPQSYIRNRWDESGTRKAASARSIAYRYEERRLGVASIDYLAQRADQVRERRLLGSQARVEHDVPLGTESVAMQAKCLSKPSFDTVTYDGSSDGAGDGEPQPRPGCRSRPRPAKGSEQRAGDAKALVIDEPEFGGAQDPGRFRKSSGSILRTPRRRILRSRIS